jgi:hypothetical protein
VRSLLHSSRSGWRGIGAAAALVLALVASLLTIAPAQALSDTGTGGVFVPASGRALDTLNGTGGYSTQMPANTWRTVKIAGLPGIPNDGSVGAVSLNATVSGTADYGTLFGRPDADTSRTTMMIYNGKEGEYVSNSAVVAVSAAGTIQVSTETAARLILDVQGYYTASTDGVAAGGFVAAAGKRIVDTRSGLGAPKALLAPGQSVDIQVAGANGVPSDASGAVVNLLPINTTSSDGYLTPYATGTTRPDNALHYAPSANTSIQAQVKLSSSGKMTIYNGSSTINLVIDLQGYFTAAGTGGASFTPGVGRVFDSRASGSSILAKNETRAIPVAGKAGVPVMGSGITAVVLTLTAAHGGSDGRASVWANGTAQPDTTSINFQADEIRTNTVTVPLGANGKINLNNIAAPTDYIIDVQGWYVNLGAAKITCAAPAADRVVLRNIPAAPISCEVSVGPATQADEFLAVSVDYGQAARAIRLSESESTTRAFTIPNVSGQHSISATRRVGTETSVPSDYVFTIGDWRDNEYDSSPELTRDTSLTPALFIDATDTPFPEDAMYRYTVFSDFAGEEPIVTSDWTDDAWVVPSGILNDGVQYYWSAVIRGTSDYSGATDAVTTPKFGVSPSQAVVDDLVDIPENEADTEITPDSSCDLAAGSCASELGYRGTGWGSWHKSIKSKKLVEKSHRKRVPGAYCEADGRRSCDAEVSATISAQWGTSLGISVQAVAAGLNQSYSASFTISSKCTASRGHSVQAYFTGPKYKYKVKAYRDWYYYDKVVDGGRQTKTSGWLTSWIPKGIACKERRL